jgi:hypothetical protein
MDYQAVHVFEEHRDFIYSLHAAGDVVRIIIIIIIIIIITIIMIVVVVVAMRVVVAVVLSF